MDYNKLELFVSKARLDRFLTSCNGSKVRALELYKSNLLISQAFYPVLNLFEIFLRNSINRQLISYFHDNDWIINQKLRFMDDPSLVPSRYFLRESINKAETRIVRKGLSITSGRIIAEQSFGFWTSLFERHHFSLIRGSIMGCFPLKPSWANRSRIAVTLQGIRDFRNRIYHNEPICFNCNSINFGHAERIRQDIYSLLNWMDSETANHILFFDNINNRIITAKRV